MGKQGQRENLLIDKSNSIKGKESESIMKRKYIRWKINSKNISKYNRCECINIRLSKTMKSICLKVISKIKCHRKFENKELPIIF